MNTARRRNPAGGILLIADPVSILKKEQEGKPYNVAKMAGVNKFLRIYYARAMELYR